MHIQPHDFWQELIAADELPEGVLANQQGYAAALPDGRRILLPIRVLPGGTERAVASLIVNQASFEVLDALADALAEKLEPHQPDVIIGIPTLGLPLAEGVARRLGHVRKVALGTSRKFWYDEALSEPLSSITTPEQAKRIYVDPRMLPLLREKRVAIVDDVISSGKSIAAVMRLMAKADIFPVGIGVAMLQSQVWREKLDGIVSCPVHGVIETPILERDGEHWRPEV